MSLGQVSEVLERRGESQPIQPGAIGVAQVGREIQSQLLGGPLTTGAERGEEELPLFGRQRWALLPGLGRRGSVGAPGATDGVGQLLGVRHIVGGPAERMAGGLGVLMGVGFQHAVATFHGAVVLRLAGGREELGDEGWGQSLLSHVGQEGRTVVMLDHQGRSGPAASGPRRRPARGPPRQPSAPRPRLPG